MTWSKFLFFLSGAVTLTGNAIVLFHVFPAYRRTGHRAFLLIWLAFLLGTFDTLCSHTIGLQPMDHTQYLVYNTLRRFAYFAVVALDTTGIVWLTQSYLQRISRRVDPPPDAPTDGGDAQP